MSMSDPSPISPGHSAPRIESYTGKRCTYTTSKPFDVVITSLRASVIAGETFQSLAEEAVKTGETRRGLFLISEVSHGKWYQLYDPTAPRMQKFMMGNPFVMKNIAQHDLAAFLHAPLNFLVMEVLGDNGQPAGTKVIFDLASSVMESEVGGQGLQDAARVSDERIMERVATWL